MPPLMHLRVLLPFQVFAENSAITRIVAETREGSFGLLPQRLDCVAALVPGILTYETEADDPVFLAVDEGVLVKVGSEVLISVRRAIVSSDLSHLHALVAKQFLDIDASEREARAAMSRLESGFLHRFAALHHE
jgi:F-type H+-transporting ATPase subunit epsilon